MEGYGLPIESNPLRNRNDAVTALMQMLEPLKKCFSKGGAFLHNGNFSAHYGERSGRMEGYSRLLWGLGPLWARENEDIYLPVFRNGLISGTDPSGPEYWGDVYDRDQKMVEMAAISLALCLAPEKLWDPLTDKQKNNMFIFLDGINHHDMPNNNWLFFRVLVNTMFRLRGLKANTERLESDLARLDGYYLEDGWYYDGEPTQTDYYIAFAMHYYGLVYSVLAKDLDPARAELFRSRAKLFAPDFMLWFGDRGEAVPFGRSLTYRFAQSSFFSALAFANVEALPWGVIKAQVLGNLRHWLKQPIFSTDGILTVGYHYPNLFMSEIYNAPGSPYWAFKSFLILALGEDHPFWQAEEESMPLPSKKHLPHADMIAVRDKKSSHAVLYPAGRRCVFLGSHTEKYEKLAYSSAFGFSMSRGPALEEGAFDNTIAFSEAGKDRYMMRQGYERSECRENYTHTRYRPMNGVAAETFVVPFMPWHVRVHIIETDINLDVADGAFAIAREKNMIKYLPGELILVGNSAAAAFKWGVSGIIGAYGPGTPKFVFAQPNTNLCEPLTVIPTWTSSLAKGRHILTTYVIGDVSPDALKNLQRPPEISWSERCLYVSYEKERVCLDVLRTGITTTGFELL